MPALLKLLNVHHRVSNSFEALNKTDLLIAYEFYNLLIITSSTT